MGQLMFLMQHDNSCIFTINFQFTSLPRKTKKCEKIIKIGIKKVDKNKIDKLFKFVYQEKREEKEFLQRQKKV